MAQAQINSAFRPYCIASALSGAVTAYFQGDADYSQRLTDHITLFRSIETDEIVGCRIKGVALLFLGDELRDEKNDSA